MNKKVKSRLIWVDTIKLVACFFVIFAHLLMSLNSCGLLNNYQNIYLFIVQTSYTFHVPLFFFCSGFLYQRRSIFTSKDERIKFIYSKLINFGVPYLIFSIISLSLKYIFSSSVNTSATPILKTLFLTPMAPYWFLYALFIIFCIFPVCKNKKNICILLGLSIVFKILYINLNIKFLDLIGKPIMFSMWFLLGMLYNYIEFSKSLRTKIIFLITSFLAIIIACFKYSKPNDSKNIQLIIGFLLVISIVYYFSTREYSQHSYQFIKKYKDYYLPIFLLHTIYASAFRIILLKCSIYNLGVHIIIGLVASVLLPIITYNISKKNWFLLFIFEPYKGLIKKNISKEKRYKDSELICRI